MPIRRSARHRQDCNHISGSGFSPTIPSSASAIVLSSREVFWHIRHDERSSAPVQTLVTSFKRALVDEVVASWVHRGLISLDRRVQSVMTRERNAIEDHDFDLRLMQFAGEGFAALDNHQDKDWQRYINRAKEITEWTDELMESGWETIVMLDRIDESWDGTDNSVV